jgi:hypothetical protein
MLFSKVLDFTSTIVVQKHPRYSMVNIHEIAPKLLFAVFVGGLIDAEREFHD